jgi:hypothetical protein
MVQADIDTLVGQMKQNPDHRAAVKDMLNRIADLVIADPSPNNVRQLAAVVRSSGQVFAAAASSPRIPPVRVRPVPPVLPEKTAPALQADLDALVDHVKNQPNTQSAVAELADGVADLLLVDPTPVNARRLATALKASSDSFASAAPALERPAAPEKEPTPVQARRLSRAEESASAPTQEKVAAEKLAAEKPAEPRK